MAKIVVNIKGEPKNGDILVFEDGSFKCINSEKYLLNLKKDIKEIKAEIENIKKILDNHNKDIKLLKGEE